MEIVTPYQRNEQQWKRNQLKVEESARQPSLTFKKYCELSSYVLDAPEEYLLANKFVQEKLVVDPNEGKGEKQIEINLHEEYQRYSEEKKEEMRKQGKRIVGVIRQKWKHILDLYRGREGRQHSHGDQTGIYEDQNVNLSLAHLEKILLELKHKNYRFELFIKEYQHSASQEQKDIGEELTLVRLLQQLVETQIEKIDQAGQAEPVSNKKDPTKFLKVKDYFRSKRERGEKGEEEETAVGQIADWEKRVRFNAAVVRWQMGLQ